LLFFTAAGTEGNAPKFVSNLSGFETMMNISDIPDASQQGRIVILSEVYVVRMSDKSALCQQEWMDGRR
jgi:hypothetical protein